MNREVLINFLMGIYTANCAAVSLFFLVFWRRSRERLFVYFSLCFMLLAVERVVLLASDTTDELRYSIYLIRFVGFMLLIYGIIEKNLRRGRQSNDF